MSQKLNRQRAGIFVAVQTELSASQLDAIAAATAKAAFEIKDYSFDIEQVLNIGSQSSGAGAGKVTFNPF